VNEGIAHRAFDGLTELRAWDQERVYVDGIGVEGQVGPFELLIVDGDEDKIDIGFGPDGVVREAATENGGEDRAIFFDLRDEIVEGPGELLLDGFSGLDMPSLWRPM
jgi:hypothetical protein